MFIIGLIAVIIGAIGSANKAQNAVWRNGLPYCPNCNRQISLKTARPYCRACGYHLTQAPQRAAPPPQPPSPAELLQAEAQRKERENQRREREELDELQRAQRARDAEAARLEKQAIESRKAARREATIKVNGGYTDLQLFGFGAGLVLVPLCIIGLLIYMATH